jgi:hypothetical protein
MSERARVKGWTAWVRGSNPVGCLTDRTEDIRDGWCMQSEDSPDSRCMQSEASAIGGSRLGTSERCPRPVGARPPACAPPTTPKSHAKRAQGVVTRRSATPRPAPAWSPCRAGRSAHRRPKRSFVSRCPPSHAKHQAPPASASSSAAFHDPQSPAVHPASVGVRSVAFRDPPSHAVRPASVGVRAVAFRYPPSHAVRPASVGVRSVAFRYPPSPAVHPASVGVRSVAFRYPPSHAVPAGNTPGQPST